MIWTNIFSDIQARRIFDNRGNNLSAESISGPVVASYVCVCVCVPIMWLSGCSLTCSEEDLITMALLRRAARHKGAAQKSCSSPWFNQRSISNQWRGFLRRPALELSCSWRCAADVRCARWDVRYARVVRCARWDVRCARDVKAVRCEWKKAAFRSQALWLGLKITRNR